MTELTDKLKEESVMSSLMPSNMNAKEKVYYWTAQANACMLPFSAFYAVVGGPWGAALAGTNAALMAGSLYGLKNSYDKRHGANKMTIGFSPKISFAGKDYYLFK
jgi:hypothetical protein